MSEQDKNKRVIGLYGEMCLAMELHKRGWQVYRAYIDEHIDFIIARYYCTKCKKFSQLEERAKTRGGGTFPSDCCKTCKEPALKIETRYIQVKTSEGVKGGQDGVLKYSFHAKLRSNVDDKSFYVWVALVAAGKSYKPHFYIFNHKEISRFDNLKLPSYQRTDNQKLTLRITPAGEVVNKGRIYDYECFNKEFYNNFTKFDMLKTRRSGKTAQ